MEIIMITCIVVFVIASIFAIKQKKRSNKKNIQQQGLVYVGQIKQLISYVQQHRGLMSAWLNGDTSVQTKLAQLKQKILQLNKELSTSPVSQNERLAGFNDHWQRLLQLNNKPSVANSFEQHTMMIRNLAYLLEDTAESSYLTSDHLSAFPHVGFVWRELVLATENIGQSRALGTGVAAQHFCSSVDKIRLNFLSQTMADTVENTLQQLSSLPHEQSTHKVLISSASNQMNQLIKTISDELVNAKKVLVNSSDYFDLATNTMQKMDAIFAHQVKQLHTSL